jgi:hypothetical protein
MENRAPTSTRKPSSRAATQPVASAALQKDLMADAMSLDQPASPGPTTEKPLIAYQRLASIMLIGIFFVLLTCICSCTLIAMTFLLSVPW